MPNVQQPEMRRNENNPLVTDSVKERTGPRAPRGGGRGKDLRPAAQRSPYGPERADAPGEAPDEGGD